MSEFATKKELDILTSKLETLEKNVGDGYEKINKTLEIVAEQCREIKHNDANSIQFRNDTARKLEDIKLGLFNNEEINHIGLFHQVKNNHAEHKADHKELKEEQEALKIRVKEMEEVEAFKEKVADWKKGIFITLWIGFGGFLAGFAKTVAAFIINLFI